MIKRLAAVVIFPLAFFSCTTLPFRVSADEAGYVKIPGDSLRFWRTVMTPAVAIKYKAKGYTTFCNVFVADTLQKYFGPGIYEKVLPEGLQAPHVVYREWQNNPHLLWLNPAHYSPQQIQELADHGYAILVGYYNKKGKSHLAFVGNSRLVLFTVPPIKKLEGKSGAGLDADWLPVVVQAGTYAGVTSVVYASNGWLTSKVNLFRTGIVKFYLIRG